MTAPENQKPPDLGGFVQAADLPVIPEVAHALIKTLSNGEVEMKRVCSLIAKDATITGKVLRAANAAAFGLKRSVTTLEEAVTLIGTSQIRTVALAACMNIAFPEIPGLSRAEFWKKTMKCAGYAQWLAGVDGVKAQEAWLSGMMLRLGEVIILQKRPAILNALEYEAIVPGDRWRREKAALGFTEADVAAELTRHWFFPARLVDGIRLAAEPARAAEINQLAGVLHLAGLLSDVPFSSPDVIDTLPADLLKALGLDAQVLRDTLPTEDNFLDLSAI